MGILDTLSGNGAAPPQPEGVQSSMTAALPQAEQQAAPQQPQPAAQPEQKTPFWKSLLQGALSGIAGAKGATSFGGGIAGGVKGEQDHEQQMTDNAMNVRFANLQDAKMAADLTKNMTEQQHWNEEAKAKNDQLALTKAAFFKNAGYKVTPLQRTPDAVMTYLKTNGGSVNPYTFNDSNTIYAVTPGEDNGWKASSGLAKAIGAATYSQEQYNQLKPQQKMTYEMSVNSRLQKMAPAEIDKALELYQKQPDADQSVIDMMKQQRELNAAAQTSKEAIKDKDAARRVSGNIESAIARNDYRGKDVIDPNTGELVTVHQKDAIAGRMTPSAGGIKAQQGIGLLNEIDVGANAARQAITGLRTPFTADQQIQLAAALQDKNGMSKFLALKTLTPDQKAYVTAVNSLREGAMSYRGIAGQGAGSDQQRQALFNALPNPLQPVDMQIAALNRFDQQRQSIRASIPKVNNKTLTNPAPQQEITATGPNGAKLVLRNGQWVSQ